MNKFVYGWGPAGLVPIDRLELGPLEEEMAGGWPSGGRVSRQLAGRRGLR